MATGALGRTTDPALGEALRRARAIFPSLPGPLANGEAAFLILGRLGASVGLGVKDPDFAVMLDENHSVISGVSGVGLKVDVMAQFLGYAGKASGVV